MQAPATADKPAKRNYTQLEDIQLKWPHMVYQWIAVQILNIYFRLRFKVVIEGRQNCPKDWVPMVVAANHISAMDPPLVSVALNYRPISYMAKKELFEKNFFMRVYNVAMSSFAVNREKLELSTIKTAHKILKSGKWALGIFPEGTRHKNAETVSEAKRGVAYFAKSAKVPVLPLGIAHISDSPRDRIHICIGKPIPCEEDLDEYTAKIQQTIQDLIERAKTLR
jgi:1-acyl-sn-glycerol-3-phosphate acyltransferase